jgi:hypothetical protein
MECTRGVTSEVLEKRGKFNGIEDKSGLFCKEPSPVGGL